MTIKNKINILTNVSDFKSLLSGCKNNDLTIIANLSLDKKTKCIIKIIEYISIKNTTNKPIVIFSIKLSAEQIIQQLILSLTGLNNYNNMTAKGWVKFNYAISEIEKSDVLIDDSKTITPAKIHKKYLKLKAKYKDLALIIIDNLESISLQDESNNQKIALSLQALARDLGVSIIALS